MTKAWLFAFALTGCAVEDIEESVDTHELLFPDELPAVPGIPTPAGYGHYCSVVDGANGGWALGALPSNTSDPCGNMVRQVGSYAVVKRAGLWAVKGNNNVMVQCDGVLVYGRAYGDAAINWIMAQVPSGAQNCVFNISPVRLPIFGMPFDGKITSTSVFDYDYTDKAWDTSQFGMPGTGQACAVDRTGSEKRTLSNGTCVNTSASGFNAFEPAYDWSMAKDAPILAAADGVVRASYARHTAPMCNGSNQLELFIETQVGTGRYAEHFVMAYHHMNPSPAVASWGGKPMVPDGTTVHKGDVVAYNGTSGCSGGPHLDFMVFRLTNLTGARAYTFQSLDTLYAADGVTVIDGPSGVNGWQGQIDPFGWAAPRGVDPGAYMHIGEGPTSDQPAAIVNGGAFSINLWDSDALSELTHN
jgi:murein DD-endopeptidase MepM/ murein hydrolase activator NlpD